MRFGFEIYITEDNLGIRLWNWFIRIKNVSYDYNRDLWHSFGFCYSDSALHLRWGKRTKIFWMPWDYGASIRHEVLNEEGKFVPSSYVREAAVRKALRKIGVSDIGSLHNLNIPDGRKMHEAPYTYTLRNGEVQKTTAKFYVDELEWRWRIFHPFAIGPKKVLRCISVEFTESIGEGVGSWKGGTYGCGYEMLPNETPLETLRRMEKERKFGR